MANEEKKILRLGGLPWWQALAVVLISMACIYLGVQSSSLSGTLCSAFGLGVILYELGERLPIWNNYIGGGLLMAFFGTALLKFFNIIPKRRWRTSTVSSPAMMSTCWRSISSS